MRILVTLQLAAVTTLLMVSPSALADDVAPATPAVSQAPVSQAPASQAAEPGYVSDRIVATVGGDAITLWEVRRKMMDDGDRLSSVMAGGSGDEDEAARFQAALDDLIAERLIVAEARKMGISVTKKEVEDHIETIKKKNSWTDDDLVAAVKMLGFDDLDGYRRQAARELLKSRVLRLKVESRISVSDTDVQEVFDARYEGGTTEEEIHLYHIAFVITEDATPDQISALLQKAIEVRGQASRGEVPFEDLARQYGQDSSASRGGDVGWFSLGVLQASLEVAAFGLRDGEVSNVVQSSFGFHILMVPERRRVPLRDPVDARARVKWELSQQAFQKGYLDFVMELRKSTRIEILYVPAR
ncbi:MAG TPA: peptidylprolyl isomerase [Myxococcota bacterium]|nr:peptidylprolyl isomerase [Myxococcota bacterium]HQP94618.1 peptidylprolyl isomerase [Myxococcota bacterium]